MKLATRFSAFFLAVQGFTLVGFSLALYLLASNYLSRQIDDRLTSSLTALSAASEVGTDGVSWEPNEKAHLLSRDLGPEEVRWAAYDSKGGCLDCSADFPKWRRPFDADSSRITAPDGRSWRTRSIKLVALPKSDSRPEAADVHAGNEMAGELRYPALSLAVMAPLAPLDESLRRLSMILTLLTLTLWFGAAFMGHWLCKRALAPLTLMAAAAIHSSPEDTDARLPLPPTSDELEEMGKAFNGLLDRLHEALARQRRFTGEASHQFRTPLAGLLSHVDVALRRERPVEDYQRVLGVVRAKAVHLRQIVESLLFLARAEAESGRPDLETLDLARWIPEHLQAWEGHPRSADIKVRLCDEGPLLIQAHPLLLAQLLDNLLENACAYSNTGTPIDVQAELKTGMTSISVEDKGVGLSMHDQLRIFEPFYRSTEARQRGISGVGLGLAVVRRIALVFGGSIHVVSEPGGGSRFTVNFPQPDTTRIALAPGSALVEKTTL